MTRPISDKSFFFILHNLEPPETDLTMTEMWEDDQDRNSSSLATASSSVSEISIIFLNLGHVAFTHAS